MDVFLNVDWSKQATETFCGPATAHMYLRYALSASGSTTPLPDQNALWAAISKTQRCDLCGTDPQTGETVLRCWDTSPEALRDAVNSFAPAGYKLSVAYTANQGAGTDALIKALETPKAMPAIATKTTTNHWMIVNGFRHGETDPPPQTVGGYQLNGMYVQDPNIADANERLQLVSTARWLANFGIIPCGPDVDTYPVLTRVEVKAKPWLIFVVIVVLFAFLWWLAYLTTS